MCCHAASCAAAVCGALHSCGGGLQVGTRRQCTSTPRAGRPPSVVRRLCAQCARCTCDRHDVEAWILYYARAVGARWAGHSCVCIVARRPIFIARSVGHSSGVRSAPSRTPARWNAVCMHGSTLSWVRGRCALSLRAVRRATLRCAHAAVTPCTQRSLPRALHVRASAHARDLYEAHTTTSRRRARTHGACREGRGTAQTRSRRLRGPNPTPIRARPPRCVRAKKCTPAPGACTPTEKGTPYPGLHACRVRGRAGGVRLLHEFF